METAAIAIKSEDEVLAKTVKMETEQLNSRRSWAIWACAGAFYLYETVLRVSPGIMTEELMSSFSLTPTALGVLISCYLYSYVILQIPCGVMVDALGTRRILTASAALCAIGTFLFAKSEILIGAQVGRFLVGAGSACAFISCMKIVAEWFTPTRFALMSGMTTMMGTIGGTFGGPPLAWMVNNLGGWRQASMILAFAGVAMTIFAWLMIRDHPHGHKPHHSHEIPLRKSIIMLVTNPQVWLIGLFGSIMWLPIAAFAELWGVPYLMHTYNIDSQHASFASVMIFVGFAFGGPLAAWISDKFNSRLFAMKLSAILLFCVFSTIVLGPKIPLPVMFALLFAGGVFIGGQVLVFACVKESLPRRISGTALGFTNAIVMMGGIIVDPLLGKLLVLCWDGTIGADGAHIYTEATYQKAMLTFPIAIAISYGLLFLIKETHHHHRKRWLPNSNI